MRGRLRFEYVARDILIKRGFKCARSAGSRGAFDLVAFNDKEMHVIQVKSTQNLHSATSMTMYLDAIKEVLAVPIHPAIHQWLWIKPLRKDWIEVRLNDWSADDREGHRQRLKAILAKQT